MIFDQIDMASFENELIAIRRNLHQYPESGWTEFRTTALIIEELTKLGLEVQYGPQIHVREKMYGLPEPSILECCLKRAKSEWDNPQVIDQMAGGYTGCITVIEGALPGPTVGIRVDIDCVDVDETDEPSHIPNKEGFASVHKNCMHACGHDAHTAIGIGVAKLLVAHRSCLRGRVILLFQPAEEGVRGASSFAAAGHASNCNYFFGEHIGFKLFEKGVIGASAFGLNNAIAFDVNYKGKASHAGAAPQDGNNALAAAATAILNMLAIPRHGDGYTRINIGSIQAGTGRNVIPPNAKMEIEVRGQTKEILDYMAERAKQVCASSASMYNCEYATAYMGATIELHCDQPLVDFSIQQLKTMPDVTEVVPAVDFKGGGDDVAIIMKDVQDHGGQVTELIFGTPIAAPHHNSCFDFDESVIVIGIAARTLASLAFSLGEQRQGEQSK